MDFDINHLLANPAAFAAAISGITAFTRKHVWTGLDGKAVILFAVAVGLGLRFVLPLIPSDILNQVIGTILIAITVSGNVDALKGIAKQASTITPIRVQQ
jgi:hypothetical protein